MTSDQALSIVLNSLPCSARSIDLPGEVKRKALRTLKGREQIIMVRDPATEECFYTLNKNYVDLSIKGLVLATISMYGTIRLSMLKDKVGCSKSAAYDAVKELAAEHKLQVIAKETGRFLISI